MTCEHVAARRTALGLVMALLDGETDRARRWLASLDKPDLEAVALSLASFAIEIVAPGDRAEFRQECATEALIVASVET